MFSNSQGRVHCWGLNRLCHCCTCRYIAYCFILLSSCLVAFVAILLIVALAFLLITVTLAVCNLRCYFDITRIKRFIAWIIVVFDYLVTSLTVNIALIPIPDSVYDLVFFVLDVFWYIVLCFSQVNPYLNILKYPKFFSCFSAISIKISNKSKKFP